MAKCCGVGAAFREAIRGNDSNNAQQRSHQREKSYRPLQYQQQLQEQPYYEPASFYSPGGTRILKWPTTPRDQRRKLSLRYDAVRPVRFCDHSEPLTPHRHLPGSLRSSLQLTHLCQQQQQQRQREQQNLPHQNNCRHEQVDSCCCQAPAVPPPTSNNNCASQAQPLRLDQPVTNSNSGMDNKKAVQAMTAPVSGVDAQQILSNAQPPHSQQPGSARKSEPVVASAISGVRRRGVQNQGLRSPAAKRPVSAPVALQGWLHKQGSEGLMLWKKRWFVLSEYCLFYYKGPEEEKLLGSILLPSYRVTVCRPEDKINKRFAFKAEHANMRTYHFAADTLESMNQWVNVLTLATLLQDPNPGGGNVTTPVGGDGAAPALDDGGDRSARPSVSSISSIANQSADDSDSGFHGFQSRDDPSHASNNNSSPNSVNTGSFPGSSGSNNNAPLPNNPNLYNNNASLHENAKQQHHQPMANGWMQQQQQQSSQYRHHPDLVSQSPYVIQQQPHQQAGMYLQQQQQQHSRQSVHNMQPMPRNYGQPVYANAPPKPRRLAENSNEFGTPSPDLDYRQSPVSPDARYTGSGSKQTSMSASSSLVDYNDPRSSAIYAQRMAPPQPSMSLRTDKSGLNYGMSAQQQGQKTPDLYARAAAKSRPAMPRLANGTDYEDVYGATPPQLYQRPAGPVGYTKGPAPAPISIPVHNQQQQQSQSQPQPVQPQYYVVAGSLTNAPVIRQQPPPPEPKPQPPRPHSADFLEYETNRKPSQQTPAQPVTRVRYPQRPKSSLDVINPSDVPTVNDNYFYSEERYAAQMRQSGAVYLQHQSPAASASQSVPVDGSAPMQRDQQSSRNQSLSRATTPSKSSTSRDTESGIGTLSDMSYPTTSSVRRAQRDHHQQSLQRHNDRYSESAAHTRRSLRETSSRSSSLHQQRLDLLPSPSSSRSANHTPQQQQGSRRWSEQQQQQFARSASARLPRNRHPAAIIDYDDNDDDDEYDDYIDKSMNLEASSNGERKMQQREESMKRLLEWKQRMLQSPLTRKPHHSGSGGSNQPRTPQHSTDLANCYKQQALMELAAHEASLQQQRQHRRGRGDEAHHRPHYPRSKSTDARRSNAASVLGIHAALPRYNSYSSDDEASGSGSVIGRDPLPPRAVSTSQLANQRQSPALATTKNNNLNNVSQQQQQTSATLPHQRSLVNNTSMLNGIQHHSTPVNHHNQQQQQQQQKQQQLHHHQQQQQQHQAQYQNLTPIHKQPSSSQSTAMLSMLGHDHDRQLNGANGGSNYANHILRAASSGDVRTYSNEYHRDPRIASPCSAQRLVSPTSHLRVISPIDPRISSPSDSERLTHSISDRGMSSPLARDPERGSNPTLRQMQRGIGHRQSNDLLHKRSQSSSRIRDSSSRISGGLVQVSAGELLGRTHEELVLLLIQLRRQSATLCKAMETCHMEIEAQARLVELDTPRRLENLQKLDELKKHLMDLEKQYEKGKPLVNLVDNMVKLGSLYNCNRLNGAASTTSLGGSRYDLGHQSDGARDHRDRLEFNQRVQEQRLLAEERRDWDRLSPDHGQLQAVNSLSQGNLYQSRGNILYPGVKREFFLKIAPKAKVQQLYKLDQLLQEESGTLHSLQQNKELLEKALGGLRHKMQGRNNNPAEVERYREQQMLLERELSRVRLLLAHNSKKLEETVAENARLEQDLVVLRQKLQASRRYQDQVPSRDSTANTTQALEKELRRVQQLVGDLQRQRQELSVQVRQLTEKSHSLVQQIRPQSNTSSSTAQVHQAKKRTPNTWLETDLDSGVTQEHGHHRDLPTSPASSTSTQNSSSTFHSSSKQNGHGPYRPNLNSPQYASSNQTRSPVSTSSTSSSSQYGTRQVPGQSQQQQQQQPPTLSPHLREQIQQHQLKQQMLKDQMQGKASSSPVPLYANAMVPDPRRQITDSLKHYEHMTNGGLMLSPPEYVPPPPPAIPDPETMMMNGSCYGQDDNKFTGLLHNREKPEIKTVRIVKRESERRQRDRGDRSGNLGIPLTNGLQAPGGAKRFSDDDYGGSQNFESQLDRVLEESPMLHAQSNSQLSDLDEMQFQRSMSLPRGFGGKTTPQQHVQPGPVPTPPRSDSMAALRNMIARRQRIKLEMSQDSDSTYATDCSASYVSSPINGNYAGCSSNYSTSPAYSPPYSMQSPEPPPVPAPPPVSSLIAAKVTGNGQEVPASVPAAAAAAPAPGSGSTIFKSEAAKQIIKEMSDKKPESSSNDGPVKLRKRQVPREKRRHYTVSSSQPNIDLEDAFTKMGMGRARDDLDMERALRPRINAPDVVRSTLSHKELKYNESTIDSLLGAPNKIFIPERYVPEKTPELSAEEKEQRLKKAESIRKMLSETTVTSADGADDEDIEKSETLKKKVAEEKRQRNHILQLNQILAKQVMEKSKMVAANARSDVSSFDDESTIDDSDDLSPSTPMPLYQQRDNYYS
uniref:PH domain-containing protein n=1 Tax=Trichogramma kaykai TaxID=54128 RepID=A0ABD2W9F8_9HYME